MTERPVRGGWPVALGVAAFYTAGMAIVMAIATVPYAQAHRLLGEVWWAVAILAALTVAIAWWTRLSVQRSLRVTWFSLLLIVPVVGTLIGGIVAGSGGGTDVPLVALVAFGTIFVGIGEEVAFRGIVLNALGQRVSVPWAVVVSSLLFGLMHLSNIVASPPGPVLVQVVVTACVGLLFAWTYISTGGNLVLLIVLHAVYDASLIGAQATDLGSNALGTLPALVMALIGVGAAIVQGIRYRGRRLADVMAG